MWIVWLEKKILKTLAILLGVVVILITALHFYVVNNAESLIEELVRTESNGKLNLKVKNIKFNYFSKKVELQNVSFFSNDSLDLKTSYHLDIDNIRLKVKALIPIFTRKELLIDSIYLSAPKITVTRLKESTDTITKKVSIPEEMGRIYNSMINALKMFQVTRFEMNEGSFTLVNKVHPEQLPLTVSNLHIHVDDLKLDTAEHSDKLFSTNQMVFRTINQDILFPDGNHRLAFSKFRINIRRKFIQIDSCTISGKNPGDNRSEFKIFLDTLRLINVDFKALYENELIKADTVFCRNPDFKILLEAKEKKGKKNTLPNMDTLIQQLTGDLLLNYIGVTNASIDITSYKDGNPTSFTSDKNNFIMEGLSIDQNRPQPVSLEGFEMAINNYENFVKDSSYFLRFDSIRLRENRILLSNFSINTEPYRDTRNIKVRQFALSGLSWADLLFNRKIKANQATLIDPIIDYVQPEIAKKKNSTGFISSLDVINRIMDLQKLQIINGQIKISTRDSTEILLQNTSLLLNSREVVISPTVTNVERSVEQLSFSKGVLKLKDLRVNMENASFDGKTNRLLLGKMNLYDHDQSFNVNSTNTLLGNVQFNDSLNIISVDTINWSKARVEINAFKKEKKDRTNPLAIVLKMINGKNTAIDINNENSNLSFTLNSLTATSISKNEKIRTEKVNMTGNDLSYSSPTLELRTDSFVLNDNQPSFANLILFTQKQGVNTIEVKVPEISFTPDINSVILNNADIKNVKLNRPEIKINSREKNNKSEAGNLPDLKIDRLEILHPLFNFESSIAKSMTGFNWNGNKNQLIATKIVSDKSAKQISISTLDADFSEFSFKDSSGKQISSGEGSIKSNFENLLFQPGETLNWSTNLKELTADNFSTDSVGKKPASAKLISGKIENLNLNSEIIKSLPTLIKENPDFIVSNVSGYIVDQKNDLQWHNLSYSKSKQIISLDSISYIPVVSRDDFIAANPFQTDYMTLRTGKISVSKFDLDQILKDSILRIGELDITDPYFTSFRDKRPPFKSGIIKPLPTKMIQKIPFKVSIDTINIFNGTTVYAELNDKNNETGVIPVTRMSGDIFPIKNFDITEKDTLRIRLNGFLLDSAWLRLRTRESYLDSLSGFQITLRMRPRTLLYLNSVLEPLASVRIQSGNLDTLVMRAIATEHLSLGEMRMFYNDLKVQFLRNSSEDKKRFLKGLMTFIANSFVIKNKNTKRVGVVYFPRIRDRSFINYYIKIAMSGMASSVGAKKNKRLLRKYKKQLKIRQLPPIDFD